MSSDPLSVLKSIVADAEFAKHVRCTMGHVRLIHESDEQTFRRMMHLAVRLICPECRGYGHRTFGDPCSKCNATGVRLTIGPPQCYLHEDCRRNTAIAIDCDPEGVK